MQSKRTRRRWATTLVALGLAAPLVGCVTVAEFRKLDDRVNKMERAGGAAPTGGGQRLADLQAQVTGLEQQIADLQGRVEVAEHGAERAAAEARAAREEAAAAASRGQDDPDEADEDLGAGPVESGVGSAELAAYREAYAAWRADDPGTCIDRFRTFLQTYPSSPYADDAAYWMADCYFKQGDFKTAVLRFDDVVNRYPTGNKAPDALYRQGEALMRMGPAYGSAAGKAFERVLQEYPDSSRAAEAKRQLEVLGSG